MSWSGPPAGSDRANDHLPGILGVPSLPYLTFDGEARFGTAHWKLAAIEDYAGDRPLAGSTTASTRAALSGPRRGRPRPCWSQPTRASVSRTATSRRSNPGPRTATASASRLRNGRGRGLRLVRDGGRLADHLSRRGLEDPGLLRHLARLVGVEELRRVRADEEPGAQDHGFRRWRRQPRPEGPRRGPHGGTAVALPDCPPGGRRRTPRSSLASHPASLHTSGARLETSAGLATSSAPLGARPSPSPSPRGLDLRGELLELLGEAGAEALELRGLAVSGQIQLEPSSESSSSAGGCAGSTGSICSER